MNPQPATEALAAFLEANVDCDPVHPWTPTLPHPWSGYVWPAPDWMTVPDDAVLCPEVSVGVVVDFVAAINEPVEAQRWLSARVGELWTACSTGVDIGDGVFTHPTRTFGPELVVTRGGTELLAVRTEFARFTLEAT